MYQNKLGEDIEFEDVLKKNTKMVKCLQCFGVRFVLNYLTLVIHKWQRLQRSQAMLMHHDYVENAIPLYPALHVLLLCKRSRNTLKNHVEKLKFVQVVKVYIQTSVVHILSSINVKHGLVVFMGDGTRPHSSYLFIEKQDLAGVSWEE